MHRLLALAVIIALGALAATCDDEAEEPRGPAGFDRAGGSRTVDGGDLDGAE